MPAPLLSVVIPVFNEQSRIVETLGQVLGYLGSQQYSWEVVVADDGSTDCTSSLVQNLIESRPNTHLRHVRLYHKGKGWAIKQGMLHALGEYRFMCDADLSMTIEQITRFLPPEANNYDVAIGSREVPGARKIGEPKMRKMMGRVFSQLVRALALPGLVDTQCGFKCFHANAAEILFRKQLLHGFAFDVEVLFLARKQGLRVIEVPIDWYYNSQSKVRPVRDAVSMLKDTLRIRWHYLRGLYGPD
jgi:dolichyl-phosphate beta-glucosyltransferase